MGAISDDLDKFQETGLVPELEDEDFAPQGENPMLASIGGAVAEAPPLLSPKQGRKGMAEKRAEILRLAAEGWGQKAIAAELHSSLSTVGQTIREGSS